jgi:hypothetical protein
MLKKIERLTRVAIDNRRMLSSDEVWRNWLSRELFTTRYAWAIPSQEAIELLVGLSPIVEIGAGLGLWAHLVTKAGGSVVAYDAAPASKRRSNHWANGKQHFPVRLGGPRKARKHPGATLLLCWPPMSSMAYDALCHYQGNRVVYVGEGCGGCTGDGAFHRKLEEEFEVVGSLAIPQWAGLHDDLTLYHRR